jgi:hypothetical protein
MEDFAADACKTVVAQVCQSPPPPTIPLCLEFLPPSSSFSTSSSSCSSSSSSSSSSFELFEVWVHESRIAHTDTRAQARLYSLIKALLGPCLFPPPVSKPRTTILPRLVVIFCSLTMNHRTDLRGCGIPRLDAVGLGHT